MPKGEKERGTFAIKWQLDKQYSSLPQSMPETTSGVCKKCSAPHHPCPKAKGKKAISKLGNEWKEEKYSSKNLEKLASCWFVVHMHTPR